MKFLERQARALFTCLCLLAFSAPSFSAIEVIAIHANQPKVFSEQQCKEAFEPRLFRALAKYPASEVIATPSGSVTIGPRTHRVLKMGETEDKYLLTYFTTTFDPSAKKENKKADKKKKKTAKNNKVSNQKPTPRGAKGPRANQPAKATSPKKTQKNNRKKPSQRRKGKVMPSYLLVPMDSSQQAFLSTVYCDAVLYKHDDKE